MFRFRVAAALAIALIGMVLARPLWSRQPVELVAREDDKGKAETKALKLPAWWPARTIRCLLKRPTASAAT